MKTTQKARVRAHLKTHGSISPIEALIVHGTLRLAARVEELRREGLPITTEMKRDDSGKRYARYRLKRRGR